MQQIARVLLPILLTGLAACGGGSGGGSTSTSGGTTTGSSSSSSASSGASSSSSVSTSSGSWNLSTGANSEDDLSTRSFSTLTLDLSTPVLTSASSGLVVGTASNGVTTVTQSGSTVLTMTEDSYGITLDATGSAPLEFVLTGTYTKTVTVFSSTDFKLTLNGATINSSDGPAINVQSKVRAFVVLAGSNTLGSSGTWTSRTLADGSSMDLKATLFSEGPLIISGTGSLTASATKKHVITSDKHVRLSSGTLDLNATTKDGIRANDAFVMDGGSLTISTAAGKGIKVEGKEDDSTPLGFIAINDGTLTITSYDKAITASWEAEDDAETTSTADDPDARVTINGGTITVTTTGTPYETSTDSLSPEGIEAKSTLAITGGTLVINTTDDGLNAGTHISISGGRIYVKSSSNDAVDSNGTMSISGGLLVAIGAGAPEGGLDCDRNTFAVTGGTFIGIGGANSSVTAASSTQNTVSLSNISSGTLAIRDSSGNTAFAYTMPSTAAAVVLSTPKLTTGTRYTVYSGGTLSNATSTFNGLYIDATHSGGTAGGSFTISSTVSTVSR